MARSCRGASAISMWTISTRSAGSPEPAIWPATQALYHLRERAIENAVIPWCERNGVAVVAYSPFGHAGGFPGPHSAGGRVLKEIADRHRATPRQVALRFLTRRASVFAIPKAATPAHTEENAGAGALHLSAAELARIDAAFPLDPRPRPLPML
jgi:diketogulonate reductase-like aldo/keto reductase